MRRRFLQFLADERTFLSFVMVGMLTAGVVTESPETAMWVGFLFAGYAAVANDSIQTIGTFIASNRTKPWWALWLFIGGIFYATVTYSWMNYGGDVSYGRLASKGFETAPTQFSYLQVAAPLFLIILTRLRMPVSTTFLLLSSFSTKASSIGSMAIKSLSGYGIAFVLAFLLLARCAGSFLEAVAGPRAVTNAPKRPLPLNSASTRRWTRFQ